MMDAYHRHTEQWYADLGDKLGHSGYVTLTEILKAEKDEENGASQSERSQEDMP